MLKSRKLPEPPKQEPRQQQVVEVGDLRAMKKCLLALPVLTIPLMGTYSVGNFRVYEDAFARTNQVDVVIGLVGTVAWNPGAVDPAVLNNPPAIEYAVAPVRGRTRDVVMLDDAQFRLER